MYYLWESLNFKFIRLGVCFCKNIGYPVNVTNVAQETIRLLFYK